jgi:hypothetical protein
MQITVGHLSARCCESLHALANGTLAVDWPVSRGSRACLVHSARAGAIALSGLALGPGQSVRAYDHHARMRTLTMSGEMIDDGEGIGALMLAAGESDLPFRFLVRLSDPDGAGRDFRFLPMRRVGIWPVAMLGSDVAHFRMGGCAGVTCEERDTGMAGNTGGIPSQSDGDPVDERDDGQMAAQPQFVAGFVVLVVAVVLTLYFGLCRTHAPPRELNLAMIVRPAPRDDNSQRHFPERTGLAEEEDDASNPYARPYAYGGIVGLSVPLTGDAGETIL